MSQFLSRAEEDALEDRAVFDHIGKVDITKTHYRKIRFEVKEPLRKKHRANSTADFWEDRA